MRIAAFTLALLLANAGYADDSCPMHAQHSAHAEAVRQRGDKGMGFSQSRTVHHFTLLRDGGTIEVSVADPSDDESRSQIQEHLGHVAHAFGAGDFRLPMFIHAQTPPGVPTMQRLKDKIEYTYEPTPTGGRVRIATKDAKAIAAVHSFLRFQIADHETGDPTTVQQR